jgi:hypothetical protein
VRAEDEGRGRGLREGAAYLLVLLVLHLVTVHALEVILDLVLFLIPLKHVRAVRLGRPQEGGVDDEGGVPACKGVGVDAWPTAPLLRMGEAAPVVIDVGELLGTPRGKTIAALGDDVVLGAPVLLGGSGRWGEVEQAASKELQDGPLITPRGPPRQRICRGPLRQDVGVRWVLQSSTEGAVLGNERCRISLDPMQRLKPVAND